MLRGLCSFALEDEVMLALPRTVQRSRVFSVSAAVALLAACDEPIQPVRPAPAQRVASQFFANAGRTGNRAFDTLPPLADSILAVQVGVSERAPALEGDQALIDAVQSADGRVYIGLKPPDAVATRAAGIIPAIGRATAMSARREIETLGARIVRSFVNSSTVVAVLPSELAPRLRKLSFVNYVEPASFATLSQGTQDTSWGARKINAPAIWPYASGGASYITILDTGVDQTHLFGGGDGPAFLSDCLYTPSATITGCFDDVGHGSHVAGIAAAWNNDFGVIGIAWRPPGLNKYQGMRRQPAVSQ